MLLTQSSTHWSLTSAIPDVPAVQAVHTVGWVPEKARGGQRHPASGVTIFDSAHEGERTAVGALNPNSSFFPIKTDRKFTTCWFLFKFLKLVCCQMLMDPDYKQVLCCVYKHCVSCHKQTCSYLVTASSQRSEMHKLSIFIQLETHSIIPVSTHFSTCIHLISVGFSWYHFWKLKLSHYYFLFYVLSCIVQLECFLINRKMFLWILSCLSVIFTFKVFCLKQVRPLKPNLFFGFIGQTS